MTTIIDDSVTDGCPFDHSEFSQRKIGAVTAPDEPAITQISPNRWKINSFDLAKQILRGRHTIQAGFGGEIMRQQPSSAIQNLPVLIQEGAEHTKQRTEIARFFTPKTVNTKYFDLMDSYSDQLMNEIKQKKVVELSDYTLKMAVKVTANIVGLTNSNASGLSRRVNHFLKLDADAADHFDWSLRLISRFIRSQFHVFSFLFLDVKPAIRARKKSRQDDVISYLLDKEYSDMEIMIESVTYGTAGMVTTREFITVAAWHLLSNEELRTKFLNGNQAERYQLLEEILRNEPIVGKLIRKAVENIPIKQEKPEQELVIQAGDIIELDILSINSDPSAVGEHPSCVVPFRQLKKKTLPPVMSFGDGHHRCPGAYTAIQESDIFLRKLFALDGLRLVSKPTTDYVQIIQGYELRNFKIQVD